MQGEYLTNLELERVLADALRSLGVRYIWANEGGESFTWPDFKVILDDRVWHVDCKGSAKHWGSLYHDVQSLAKDKRYHDDKFLWYVTNDLAVFSFDEMLEGMVDVWNRGRQGWCSAPTSKRSISDWIDALRQANEEDE